MELLQNSKGPSINNVVLGGGGQKFPILLSKKTTKRGGLGQNFLILRGHSLWTTPNTVAFIHKSSTRKSRFFMRFIFKS